MCCCSCYSAGRACTNCCPHDIGLCLRRRKPRASSSPSLPSTPNPVPLIPSPSQVPTPSPRCSRPNPPPSLDRLPLCLNTPTTQPRTPRPTPHLQTPHPPPIPHAAPPDSDFPGFPKTTSDLLLADLYGNHVHWNPGNHLNGGIDPVQDCIWQRYFRSLTAYLPHHYAIPRGPIADRFINTYATLIHQVVDRAHNSENPLVFVMVILQRNPMSHAIGMSKLC